MTDRDFSLEVESSFHFVELLLELIRWLSLRTWLMLVFGDQKISPPIARVEAPVTGPVLTWTMRVTDKLLWGEQAVTFKAFNAMGEWLDIEFGHIETDAFAETFVIYFECQCLFAIDHRTDRRLGRVAVQKGGTQTFGICFGYQTTTRGWGRNDRGQLEHFELVGGAPWTKYLQFVANTVYLWQTEVS